MSNPLTSQHLTLTKLAPPDWELIRSIYTNPALMQHIGSPMSEDAIRSNFAKELAPWTLDSTHWLTWIIRETDTGNDVGLISICTRDRDVLTAEVGFIILDTHKGKGYATEALAFVLNHAAHAYGFRKFTAVCSEEHAASRKVLEKAGMQLDKIVPEHTEIAGAMVNDCFYSLEK